MYGIDVTINERDTDYVGITTRLHQVWVDDWIYLATDSTIIVKDLDQKEVKGLKLPREVIDKIYNKNAERFYNIGKK